MRIQELHKTLAERHMNVYKSNSINPKRDEHFKMARKHNVLSEMRDDEYYKSENVQKYGDNLVIESMRKLGLQTKDVIKE